MRTMLRTPGLSGRLGRTFGLLTVTGAVTGTRYTTPVQYMDRQDGYVVLSQTIRRWWRNIRTRPDVELVVRGRTLRCRARIAAGEEARTVLGDVLELNPRVAKFYGIAPGGPIEPAVIDQLLERMVVIVITPG
jgi:deazaflavin-dependent oxidoreductase (nitroreductase family)